MFVGGMNSIPEELRLDVHGLLTPEEYVTLWEIDNYERFSEYLPYRVTCSSIVDDILAKARERLASGERGADLRFGHDYTFLPLLMCLDVNGYGHSVENSDDIPVWCRLQDVPMGANLHLVFYRPKRSGPILFKVLLNGQEARLPIPTDNWPYYRWDYFKQAYGSTAVLQPK